MKINDKKIENMYLDYLYEILIVNEHNLKFWCLKNIDYSQKSVRISSDGINNFKYFYHLTFNKARFIHEVRIQLMAEWSTGIDCNKNSFEVYINPITNWKLYYRMSKFLKYQLDLIYIDEINVKLVDALPLSVKRKFKLKSL